MLVGAGPLAFVIAYTGLNLPLKESLAVAACLTPSSSGIAITQLRARGAFNTPLGQLVVATTLAEDLISLSMLQELRVLSRPSALASEYFVPVVVSFGFAIAIGLASIYMMPHVVRALLTRVPTHAVEWTLLLLLLSLAVGLVAACNAAGGSPLLGAFLAGLSFCEMHSTVNIWRHQVKRIASWLIRIFFACTVGFSIPVKLYGRRRVWRNAAAFYAATWGKMLAGAFAEPLLLPEALALGFAMSTLGEFSFISGTTAHSSLNLMSIETYASVALAVLGTIFISPVALSASLRWMARRAEAALERRGAIAADDHVFYKLDVKVIGTWGLVGSLINVVTAHDCSIVDFRVSSDGPFAYAEAFLKDEKLRSPPPPATLPPLSEEQAASPEAVEARVRAMPIVPGLAARMAELRAALLCALAHDKQAQARMDGGASDEEKADYSNSNTVDFGALRGLVVRHPACMCRMLPSNAAAFHSSADGCPPAAERPATRRRRLAGRPAPPPRRRRRTARRPQR